jgi:hypothetical protein
VVLSIVPVLYVSRGKKKRGIVSVLSVVQFTISIALVIATLTVNRQTGLIRRGGEGYRGLIEIDNRTDDSQTASFVAELRTHPELGGINTTESSILHSHLRQIVIPGQEQGRDETYLPLLEFSGDADFLPAFGIGLLQGMHSEEALGNLSRPVYINRRFAELFVAEGENPVGKPLKSYDKGFDYKNREDGSREHPVSTIAGVVQDFFTQSLEEVVYPATIRIRDEADCTSAFVYFRLDGRYPERLETVRQVWEKHHPGRLFVYRDVYRDFIARNQNVFGLAELLALYTSISILLVCFGVFGMSQYAAEQRTKEIGIRKVNGSTTWQILVLLNRRFAGWIGLAYVIAVPVVWWLLEQWMQRFAYRTGFSLGTCFLSLLLVSGITLGTVGWHSYRAASGNPVDALRDE